MSISPSMMTVLRSLRETTDRGEPSQEDRDFLRWLKQVGYAETVYYGQSYGYRITDAGREELATNDRQAQD